MYQDWLNFWDLFAWEGLVLIGGGLASWSWKSSWCNGKSNDCRIRRPGFKSRPFYLFGFGQITPDSMILRKLILALHPQSCGPSSHSFSGQWKWSYLSLLSSSLKKLLSLPKTLSSRGRQMWISFLKIKSPEKKGLRRSNWKGLFVLFVCFREI